MSGELILVPTPLGNLGDLTIRAQEILESCDLVACEDTRRTGKLLVHLGIEKPLYRFDDHAGQMEAERLAEALRRGRRIAYCSDAGMPGINDPGFELARLAREIGADVTVLPGPSAVTLALVASGLPCHAFSFWGYVPAKAGARIHFLQKLSIREETTIVYETPHRIRETLAELERLIPERELALGRELTKVHECWYRGRASQILESLGSETRGELVLVLAGADAKRLLMAQPVEKDPELPDWARRFLAAAREGGMTLREAVKPLARHLGIPASELYKQALGSTHEPPSCSVREDELDEA